MPKLLIIYDSQTGNTLKMAEAILEGGQSVEGVEVILRHVKDANIEELASSDAIILGSPTHYSDVTDDMKALLEELKEVSLAGKLGAAFGSYGGPVGEAINILNRAMADHGMELISAGLFVKLAPEAHELEECRRLGKTAAGKIKGLS